MQVSERIKPEFWRYLRRAQATVSYYRELRRDGRASLTAIMDYHGSDKGTLHVYATGFRVGHTYSRSYDELFTSRRYRPIALLEIGVGPKQPGVTGAASRRNVRGSVTAWREYFAAGEIHAADIVDCRHLSRDRLTIHVADQSSRKSMAGVARAIGSPLDIVIDDGSHASAHQQITLAALLPYLADDAIYVIEDLQWQPADLDDGVAPKTIELLRSFATHGSFSSPILTTDEQTAIERQLRVVSIREGIGKSHASFAVLARRGDYANRVDDFVASQADSPGQPDPGVAARGRRRPPG